MSTAHRTSSDSNLSVVTVLENEGNIDTAVLYEYSSTVHITV